MTHVVRTGSQTHPAFACEYPGLDLNQGPDFRGVRCSPLHHRDAFMGCRNERRGEAAAGSRNCARKCQNERLVASAWRVPWFDEQDHLLAQSMYFKSEG